MCFTCTLQCLSNYLSHGEHTSSSVLTIAWKDSVKKDSSVIFNKITSSSMTLWEENRHSYRVRLANERYFHIKSFSGERFSAIYRAYLIPRRALLSQKGLNISHNGLFFPEMELI